MVRQSDDGSGGRLRRSSGVCASVLSGKSGQTQAQNGGGSQSSPLLRRGGRHSSVDLTESACGPAAGAGGKSVPPARHQSPLSRPAGDPLSSALEGKLSVVALAREVAMELDKLQAARNTELIGLFSAVQHEQHDLAGKLQQVSGRLLQVEAELNHQGKVSQRKWM